METQELPKYYRPTAATCSYCMQSIPPVITSFIAGHTLVHPRTYHSECFPLLRLPDFYFYGDPGTEKLHLAWHRKGYDRTTGERTEEADRGEGMESDDDPDMEGDGLPA